MKKFRTLLLLFLLGFYPPIEVLSTSCVLQDTIGEETNIETAIYSKQDLDENLIIVASPFVPSLYQDEIAPLIDEQLNHEQNISGTWGTVPWIWNEEIATITLYEGKAGTVTEAPWKTYNSVKTIIVNGIVELPSSVANLFRLSSSSGLPYLERILNAHNLDFSNVTNMDYLFTSAVNLKEVDVSSWDTSNVTSMTAVFNNTSIASLEISNWVTSNVTTMNSMFRNNPSLTYLDISGFDMSKVMNQSNMFVDTLNLSTLVVGSKNRLDTTNIPEVPTVDGYAGVWLHTHDLHGNEYIDPQVYTSSHLMTAIDDSVSGTYVWGRRSELTVYYKDSEGRDLLEPKKVEGIVKKAYITEVRDISGWQIAEVPDNASGMFGKEAQEVIYIYERLDAQPVIVKYEDLEGDSLADPTVLNGKVGIGYESEAKEILGWSVIEIPENSSGIFTEEEQTVIYIYEREPIIPVAPVDPLNPELEVEPENKPGLPENQGLLSIDFISSWIFGSQVISVTEQTYYAKPQRILNLEGEDGEGEERPNYLQISDRRSEDERNGWQLAVTQKEQFIGPDGQILSGAQVTLSDQQVVTIQGGEAPSLQITSPLSLIPGKKQILMRAEETEGMGTWIYRFGDAKTANRAVMLTVPKGANPEAISYSTAFIWELSIVPDN